VSEGTDFDKVEVSTCVENVQKWLTGNCRQDELQVTGGIWRLDPAEAHDGRAIGVFSENFTFLQVIWVMLTQCGFTGGDLYFQGVPDRVVWFH
jgi:hypothetical protein